MIAEFQIIERTELDNVVIITTRRPVAHLLRPFQTFTITPSSRYVSRLAAFATEAAALQQHAALARDLTRRSLKIR